VNSPLKFRVFDEVKIQIKGKEIIESLPTTPEKMLKVEWMWDPFEESHEKSIFENEKNLLDSLLGETSIPTDVNSFYDHKNSLYLKLDSFNETCIPQIS